MVNEDIFEALKRLFEKNPPNDKSFNSKPLIIDGTNNFIRCYSSLTKYDINGNDVGGVYGFFVSLIYAIQIIRPTRCVIFFDGKNANERRRKLFKEYKSKDKPFIPSHNYVISESSDEDLKRDHLRQFAKLHEILENLPLKIISIENLEADDCIFYACKLIKEIKNEKIEEIHVMSTDNDFYQLIDDKTKIWSPTKKIAYDKEKFKKDFGMLPENYIYYKCVHGDKSDNIDGISLGGEKNIKKHLSLIYEDRKVELSEILDEIENKKEKGKFVENLKREAFKIKRNYELMKLSETILTEDEKKKIELETLNAKVNLLNKTNLYQILAKNNLYWKKDVIAWDEGISGIFGSMNYFALKHNNSQDGVLKH